MFEDILKKLRGSKIPPIVYQGYVFSVVIINEAKTYKCSEVCPYLNKDMRSYCYHKNADFNLREKQYVCTTVEINIIVTEAAKEPWYIRPEHFVVVDEKEYTHEGNTLCDSAMINKRYAERFDYVHIGTQADVLYVYPNIKVQNIIFRDGEVVIPFKRDIKPTFTKDFYKQLEGEFAYVGSSLENGEYEDSFHSKYKKEKLIEDMNYVRVQIRKRLNNDLLSSEKQRIEEKIANKTYEIHLAVNSGGYESDPRLYPFIQEFRTEIEVYEFQLQKLKETENEKSIRIRKVEELLNIEPYKFEYVCADLLKRQGYEEVKVTKRSNDKGVDIICKKGFIKYVVQCKRYSNPVGSQDMQMFIGAMRNAEADKGIYITTSKFTREAQLMASTNNIELVDKLKLAEWIEVDADYIKDITLFD